jgi:membrane-associated phospholipid phosphatase
MNETFTLDRFLTVCRSPRGLASILMVVLTLIFLGLADEAHERELFDVDHAMHDSVQARRQPMFERPMRALSDMGSGKVLIPLNLGVAAILWLRQYRDALVVPVTGTVGVAVEGVAKWIVNRPRPKNVGYGFPSGHVMGAVIFFGLLIYIAWKVKIHPGWACLVTSTGILVVVGVAFSRIYLNAHWFSDVVGGAVAGVVLLLATLICRGTRFCQRVPAP